jgi:hypothetical protein
MSVIDSKEISVVIQGSVDSTIIDQVLNSIARWLPEAEVIVSSWKNGEDYTYLSPLVNPQVHHLVLSEDPGGFPIHHTGNQLNNINRQLRSTYAGACKASRPYCLKIRTDMLLTSANFLNYFNRYTCYDPEYKLVKSRILNNASVTADPFWHMPLHPADFFLFGYTEDIKTFFSAPLMTKAEQYYKHQYNSMFTKMLDPITNKYIPEIYLMTQFVKAQKPHLKPIENYEFSAYGIDLSYRLLVNNFVFLSCQQLGFKNLKHPKHERCWYLRSFSNLKWQKIYTLLCDPHHIIVDDEPTNCNIPFTRGLRKAIHNNQVNLDLLAKMKLIVFFLNIRRQMAKRWSKWRLPFFPNFFDGFEDHDYRMVRFTQKILRHLHSQQTLLKELEIFTNLD